MEKGFLDKVEGNAVVRIWSEKTQQEKGNCLTEGYICFTFRKVDLVPTIEEYTTLLRCPRIQAEIGYSRAANVPTFLKKLMSITRMSEQWVAARIKRKRDSICIPWKSLWDLILAHPDTKKRVDIFALSIYRLVIFLKALGHIYEVPQLGIWGAVEYAPLLVLRQYRSRQFILVTQGLVQCEVNDNVPVSSQENTRLIEEHLRVIPFELKIVKQDFEKRSLELGKKIEQLEEKKMQLGLDIDI
ncbi:hypothetical protein Gogos_019821 [Gossypium gossypioides]|uniref:DUF7745 domain-containing protein n=1 Tax=Gossypium gossypioides TaxID=34282 RepID=A0A7J9CZ52_GOSGO|nr:hypothetical protein [Gossypium gossypioides]